MWLFLVVLFDNCSTFHLYPLSFVGFRFCKQGCPKCSAFIVFEESALCSKRPGCFYCCSHVLASLGSGHVWISAAQGTLKNQLHIN